MINQAEIKITSRIATEIKAQQFPFTKDKVIKLKNNIKDLITCSYKFDKQVHWEDEKEGEYASFKRKRSDEDEDMSK